MSQLLAQPRHAVPAGPDASGRLEGEAPLRIAAATLARAASDDVAAATVIGALELDERDRLQTLVAAIGAEFDLDTDVSVGQGWFSVRFSRPVGRIRRPATTGPRSIWSRILSGLV
jgi:hypothetical protein